VRLLTSGLFLAALSAACGPPTLRPAAATDAMVACPGGATSWSLEILDQRANREGSEKLVALLRDSITKSFPGCAWSGPDAADRPSILIEVHRLSAPLEDNTWNGAAEWGVLVQDAGGRTLVEFEAQADVFRPNYRGVDNEKAALQQVFNEALKKTLEALRSVRSVG
jgi:hypothetical protein